MKYGKEHPERGTPIHIHPKSLSFHSHPGVGCWPVRNAFLFRRISHLPLGLGNRKLCHLCEERPDSRIEGTSQDEVSSGRGGWGTETDRNGDCLSFPFMCLCGLHVQVLSQFLFELLWKKNALMQRKATSATSAS